MGVSAITPFLFGIVFAGYCCNGLLFLRLWHKTRDRLFAQFGVSFALLALSTLGIEFLDPHSEGNVMVYVLRLLAFGMIIAAIVDKNRGGEEG